VDPQKFDDLVKRLARSVSRRGLLGASIGTSLAATAAAVEEAIGKGKNKKNRAKGDNKGGGKKNRGKAASKGGGKKKNRGNAGGGNADAERCGANGQRCGPRPGGKGKGKKKGRKNFIPCSRCCSDFSEKTGRVRRCACRPNGTSCSTGNPTQCCSGFCNAATSTCSAPFVS
jgi:hypothetical protein